MLYRMGALDDLTRTVERVAVGEAAVAALRANAARAARRYHPERTARRLGLVLERVLEPSGSSRAQVG